MESDREVPVVLDRLMAVVDDGLPVEAEGDRGWVGGKPQSGSGFEIFAAWDEGGASTGTKKRARAGRTRPRRVTGKRLGEMAEAAFVAKVTEMGIGVANPWGDSDPYDFITHGGGRLWKVQVKSAHRAGKDGGYSIRSHGHALKAYRADEIDVLVAYIVPESVWYVLPVRVVQRLRSLKLYPGSRRQRSKYEKYREAWGRMTGNGRG